MKATVRNLIIAMGCSLLMAAGCWAQRSTFDGRVTDKDGKPLAGALVRIERTDASGLYEVKTRKNGRYLYTGLPLGTYKFDVLVDDEVVATLSDIRSKFDDIITINFNLAELARQREAMRAAAESGTLTEEQLSVMTPEQRAAMQEMMEERGEELKKNRTLNDFFNAAMTAMKAGNFDAAIENFTKATEIKPEEIVIWQNLADTYMKLGASKSGPEQEAAYAKGLESHQQVITLKPEEAGNHNNYALALASANRFDEAQAELEKAAEINPDEAATYYYNLGALLVNNNEMTLAAAAFNRAIEADPTHAEAQYQYGICLLAQAKTSPEGKMLAPPGTKEAFQKYLELAPDGENAAAAQGLLATFE